MDRKSVTATFFVLREKMKKCRKGGLKLTKSEESPFLTPAVRVSIYIGTNID